MKTILFILLLLLRSPSVEIVNWYVDNPDGDFGDPGTKVELNTKDGVRITIELPKALGATNSLTVTSFNARPTVQWSTPIAPVPIAPPNIWLHYNSGSGTWKLEDPR
jgi:hypothetical protein